MKLKFLGTGSCEGVPAMFCKCAGCVEAKKRGGKNIRTRSQAVIDNKLLIDFPSDAYMHSLYGNVPLADIHSVLLTHAHEDHLSVNDLLMRDTNKFCFDGTDGGLLTVYSSEASGREIRERLGSEKAVAAHGVVNKVVAPYTEYDIDGYNVIPVKASHAFELDSYNYIVEKDGRSLLYAVDTGYFLDETWDYIEKRGKRFDTVVLESAYLDAPGVKTHMGIPDNVKVREQLLSTGLADMNTKFYITHMSHYRRPLQDETEARVKPLGFEVAYDYLEIEV